MRILIYGLNYAPEITGIGKYTGEMAEWLAARGHEIRVVTAPPYYPDWQVHPKYRGKGFLTESAPGRPTVFRVPLWVPRKPNGAKRLVHLLSFVVASLPRLFSQIGWRPDVVFNVEPTFFSAPFASLVAKLSGAKSWLHVQDFEVDAAFELGILPAKGPLHRLAVWLEAFFTDSFDAVSSISPKMVERSVLKGVPQENAILFPNWVDIDLVQPKSRDTDLRSELRMRGNTVVLYSGNMGAKQGLEVLAPLAKACAKERSIHFLFCGNGAFRPELEKQVRGLKNVTLYPLQPLERLNELLNTADIHLLPQRGGAADLVMPSKLTGMLSSGRPVIATADPGTQVAMVVQGRGLVVPTDDIESLTRAVMELAANSELRDELGRAGREHAVKCLGTESVLSQFERELQRLVSYNSSAGTTR